MDRPGERRPILIAENIWKSFPGTIAVKGASIRVYEGEIVGLVGENGAGKSTLLKTICGVIRRDSGRIIWLGREVDFSSPLEALKHGIMYVPQDVVLAKNLSIAENIFLGMERRGLLGFKRGREELEAARSLLKVLGADIDPRVKGGEVGTSIAQIVLIARALHFRARLIAFDEPTSALGPLEIERLLSLMLKLRNSGVSMIFVSHKIEEVVKVSDRIYVMRDGEVVAEYLRKDFDMNKIIRSMIARDIKEFFYKEKAEIGDRVLEVRNLSDYSGAVRGVSFYVRRGEILGIYGIMGSGRTEAMLTLIGFRPKKSGEIYVDGKPVEIKKPADALMHGIAYLPDDWRLSLVYLLSIKANISLPIIQSLRRANIGMISPIDLRSEDRVASAYVKSLRIVPPDPNRRAALLSGGNKQKVALAKMLATNSKVLILDEPTHGIDVGAKVEIRRLIVELAKEGKGIVLVSSDLPEVINMSDRIAVMRKGRIVAEFTREEASEERVIRAAILEEE